MNSVAGKNEFGVLLSLLLQKAVHRHVDIDNLPRLISLLNQPFGIAVQYLVVTFVRGAILGASRWQRSPFQGHRVKCRWCEVDQFRTRRLGTFTQSSNSFAELLEPLCGE